MKYVAPLAVIATASAAGPNHEMLLRAIQLFDTNATVVTPSGAAQTQTGSYGYTSHNSKDCSAVRICE